MSEQDQHRVPHPVSVAEVEAWLRREGPGLPPIYVGDDPRGSRSLEGVLSLLRCEDGSYLVGSHERDEFFGRSFPAERDACAYFVTQAHAMRSSSPSSAQRAWQRWQ